MRLGLDKEHGKRIVDRFWNYGIAIRGTKHPYENKIAYRTFGLIIGTNANFSVFEKDTAFRISENYIENIGEEKMVVLLRLLRKPILYVDREYEDYNLIKMNIAILKRFAQIKIVDNLHEKFTCKPYGEITEEFLNYAQKQDSW
jgi:hypothetical protein